MLDSLVLSLKGHWSVPLDLDHADAHVNLLGEAWSYFMHLTQPILS